jgi:hypothetical protein
MSHWNATAEELPGIGLVSFDRFQRITAGDTRTHEQGFEFTVNGRRYWGRITRTFDRSASARQRAAVSVELRTWAGANSRALPESQKVDWRGELRRAFKRHLEAWLDADGDAGRYSAPAIVPDFDPAESDSRVPYGDPDPVAAAEFEASLDALYGPAPDLLTVADSEGSRVILEYDFGEPCDPLDGAVFYPRPDNARRAIMRDSGNPPRTIWHRADPAAAWEPISLGRLQELALSEVAACDHAGSALCGNCERSLVECYREPCSAGQPYPVCSACAADLPPAAVQAAMIEAGARAVPADADAWAQLGADLKPGEVRRAGTIDLTPTWRDVLPLLLAGITDGTAEGQRLARAELQNMADLADARNGCARKLYAVQKVTDDCAADLRTLAHSKGSASWDAINRRDECLKLVREIATDDNKVPPASATDERAPTLDDISAFIGARRRELVSETGFEVIVLRDLEAVLRRHML